MGAAIKSYTPEACQPCCVCCAGTDRKDGGCDAGEVRVPEGLKKTIQYRNIMHQTLHAGDDPLAKQNTWELSDSYPPTRPESYLERIELMK